GDGKKVGRCDKAKDPAIAFPGHWAPMSLAFYTGTQLGPTYDGGLQRPERASPPAAAADPDVRRRRAHPGPHRFTIRQIAWLSSAET
ncbi:MAG TPA: hypothetical protein VHL81_03185, partial [Gemmatimonadales bacterium]|nr:hypothetical protein [Gemmatimonadales bacterium]